MPRKDHRHGDNQKTQRAGLPSRPGSSFELFISHRKTDVIVATRIELDLSRKGIRCYLDASDAAVLKSGSAIGSYFRDIVSVCTHLMVVVSEQTRGSWWVPFEIGMAVARYLPVATFAMGNIELPDYLKPWPVLRTLQDIESFVRPLPNFDQNKDSLRWLLNAYVPGVTPEQREKTTQQDLRRRFASSYNKIYLSFADEDRQLVKNLAGC